MRGGHNKKTKADLDRAGTYRGDRHNGPDLRVEVPPMPLGMLATGQALWEKVTKHLEKLGVISTVDDVALRLLCEQWVIWDQAREEVEKHGVLMRDEVTSINSRGMKKTRAVYRENPAVKTMDRAHGRMIDVLRRYGLTAADRVGLKATTPVTDPDAEAEMAELLGLN